MEINYDIIIKYLSKKNDKVKKEVQNPFVTQKNIFNYATNFPDKFKTLLTDKFYRYGISVYDNENNNISFWSSVLTLIDKQFLIPYDNDENSLVNQFKTELINNFSKNKATYLKNMDKTDLRERFKLEPDLVTIQYMVDILDLNIMILDFVSENIYVMYYKDMMNPWKQTIMLAKYNNFWEPIMCTKNKGESQRLFDYNDNIIKKILTTNNLVSYYENESIQKDFICNLNINDVVQLEKKKLGIKETQVIGDVQLEKKKLSIKEAQMIDDDTESSVKTDNDSDVFIETSNLTSSQAEILKGINKTKLNKMKLGELNDLVIKLKIEPPKKNATKAVLIDLVMNQIK